MRCQHAVLAGALLLLQLFLLSPAKAATAIYYSAPENAYGWCAGYSYIRAHSCARGNCQDAGGNACEPVVECDGGWGAVALADGPAAGIGASCGMGNSFTARSMALVVCMAAAKTLCRTDYTFSGRGSAAAAADNRAFDMTYLAQAMLQIRHYEPGTADGRMGAATRSALKAFQTALGRSPTGFLDDEVFQRLLDAIGGAQNLARIIKRDVADKLSGEFLDRTYADAPTPAPDISFSEELAARTPDEQRLALATVLASSNTKCTLPALNAVPLSDPKDGVWSITCAEGSFIVMMSADSRIIMKSGDAKDSTGTAATGSQ